MADLVVEESFIEQANSDWENQVRRNLQDANDILAPIHVEIDVLTLQTWATDRPSSHISQRLAAAEEQTNREPGNMLIAITADSSSRNDGLARQTGG